MLSTKEQNTNINKAAANPRPLTNNFTRGLGGSRQRGSCKRNSTRVQCLRMYLGKYTNSTFIIDPSRFPALQMHNVLGHHNTRRKPKQKPLAHDEGVQGLVRDTI